MRPPADVAADHPPVRSRRRIWLIVAAVVLVILIGSLRSLAGLWTDDLWFASVGQRSVFTTLLSVKVGLLLVFGVVFFLALWLNLLLVDRIGSSAILDEPEDEMVRRYQAAVHPYAGRVYAGLAVLLGLGAGASTMSQWQNYLLFENSQSFGINDPLFGKDLGFYIFRLPFLQFLDSWLLVSGAIITIIVGMFHYLNGGIRGQRVSPRVGPSVKVHLSVLLAFLAIVKAVGYLLERWALTTSTNGYVEGAGYTDVHARLPALELLFWLSLLAAAILLANIWRQGWTLPVLAVGLWAFVALIIGVLYPELLQVLKVTPAQSTLERPYIARNISATRAAFDLDHVVSHSFQGTSTVSSETLQANAQTLANIRLWDPDPSISLQTFQKLQGLKSYYVFNSVGVDRYNVNGMMTPTLAGVRQINTADLPGSSWVNTHLEYTHGDGIVIAPANQVQANGSPLFAVGNIPSISQEGYPKVDTAQVYFGLDNPGFVVVNTKQPELDYQTPSGADVTSHYSGPGGVQLSGFLRRAAFALRLGDFNLLISNLITDKSRIMFVRDIQAMAQKAAPFLSYDASPYSISVGGHIDWVLDGYTTTSAYPYSQNASGLQVPQGSGLPGSYNYVRNSVKVVINAYTGKMTYYVVDQSDPIIRAYEAAFPTLFTPGKDMPSDLRAHLRYPGDIFSAQVSTYGRYHITNPANFYNAGDAWNISQTAGAGSPSQSLAITQSTDSEGFVVNGPAARMNPIYQVNSLPGRTDQTFTITDAYVPASNGEQVQNLSAFMMGTSDPWNYGELNLYVTPPGQNVIGPVQADSEIQQNQTVSSIITPLDQHGSSVLLGNILMIPINQSMLYVRPLYVTSSGNPLPQLKYVIAVFNSHVAIESSLSVALSNVLQASVSLPGGNTGTSTSPTSNETVAALLSQAASDYNAAQAALKGGNLAGYQSNIQAMYLALLKAESLVSKTSSSSTSSATSSSSSTATPQTTTTTAPKATTTTTAPKAKESSARKTSSVYPTTEAARPVSGG